MSAFDSIVSRKPRENAGSLAANRFAYQLDWGLNKMLELEESGIPYTIIFDYHDDILVLDSEDSPNFIDFYQVKTNTALGGWRKSDLVTIPTKKKATKESVQLEFPNEESEEDEKYSKLAKLLIHSQDFGEAREFFFVTNADFGTSLIDDSKLHKTKELDFSQLKKNAREDIISKIKKELPDINDEVFAHLHFIKKQICIDEHAAIVTNRLASFLEAHYPKAKTIAKPVYETLIGEITKRNNYETEPNSVADLLKNKAFTKSQFAKFLRGLETYEDYEAKKSILHSLLFNFLPSSAAARRRSILRQMDKIKEDTLIYDNHEFLRLFSTIEKLIDETEENESNEWEWSQRVLERLKKEYSFTTIHNDDYLVCLILYELIS